MKSTLRQTAALALCLLLSAAPTMGAAAPPPFTVPVAASFSTAVPAGRQSLIQLQGGDAEGTALTYAATSTPAHGALSNLNASTGYVVYTPAAGYTGSDSFNYTVTSGGETSAAGTVTISVTSAKTRVVDFVLDAGGSPRSGKVTFILTQVVTSPAGITPVGSSVSASLSPTGQFDLSVYPSRSLNPAAYYQVWFEDSSNLKRELVGVYDVPAATAAVGLSAYKVTDTNLAARYTFASLAGIEAVKNAAANAALTQLMSVSRATGRLQKWDGTNLSDSLISESGATVTVNGSLNVTGAITGPVVTTLDNLSDVAAPTPTPGEFLRRGTSQWESAALTAADVPNLDAAKINSGQLPNARTTATAGNAPNTIVMRDDSGNFNANVITAGTFVGSAEGLTNIGGGATGGVTNTGSTTVAADTDENSVGVVALSTRNLTRLQVNNDGSVDVNGPLGTPTFTWDDAQTRLPCVPRQIIRVTTGPKGAHHCRGDGAAWVPLIGELIAWDFGVKGDGTADDTAAALEALTAGDTYNFDVRFGAGVYMLNTLNAPARVNVRGAGHGYTNATAAGNVTVFRSRAAEPLWQTNHTGIVYPGGEISDIIFDGAGLGTNGVTLTGVQTFKIRRTSVINFTGRGLSFFGSLMGTVDDSFIAHNATGVYMRAAPVAGFPGTMPPNSITFSDSLIHYNSAWGIDAAEFALLTLRGTDISWNGTGGVSDSGGVKATNWPNPGNAEALGIVVEGGYGEGNAGRCIFCIGAPTRNLARTTINNFTNVVGTTQYGVHVEGGSPSVVNVVHISNSEIKNTAVADIATTNGAGAGVRLTASNLPTRSISAGSGFSMVGAVGTPGVVGDGTQASAYFLYDPAVTSTRNAVQAIASGPGLSLNLFQNLYYNGANFDRFSTALPAWRTIYSAASDNIQDGRCAPGANPCALTTLRTLDNAGNQTLAGSLKLGDSGTRPTCDSTVRGTFWFDQGGAGVADSVAVCAKAVDGTYAWRTIY